MAINVRSKEAVWLFMFVLFLAFLGANFKERVVIVYSGFLVAYFIYLAFFSPRFNVNVVGRNTLKSIGFAIGAYVALILIHMASSNFLQGIAPTLHNMLEIITPQSVLALEKSKILGAIATILFIPLVETPVIFGGLNDLLSRVTNTAVNQFSFRLLIIWGVVSGVFTWFHYTVRGISNLGWFITFIFGMLSCYLVYKFQETESAAELHVINNAVAYFR